MSNTTAQDGIWRDRILEVKEMRAGDVLRNPRNPKSHPATQKRALEGILGEVGKADVLLAYYSARAGGKLTLFDGDARDSLNPDETWHIAITDLTDEEADKMLLVLDPLAAMAEMDGAAVNVLLEDVVTADTSLQKLLDQQAQEAELTIALSKEVSPPRGLGENKAAFVKVVIAVADVGTIEAAIRRTGKMNRGDALADIAAHYMRTHTAASA